MPGGASYERIRSIVEECRRAGVIYSIVPHAFNLNIEKVSVMDIGGIPILRMRNNRMSWVYLALKRFVDLLGAAVLITLASPFYVLFGILIKLDSTGPIIFKQKRVGLRGKEFSFYKFRTMFMDAPAYAKTPTVSDDPRITRVGRWLRRTSLDELPQLFNVLRGDMSLVGPRPEMPFIVQGYTLLQRERLAVKPGITGVWQISAVRGEPIHANLEYDLYYIENQSILLDLVILAKTVFGVIRGIGAI
jgi:exopolysaccharide biosynthesis polyprenyl glycosylphosphotransferase